MITKPAKLKYISVSSSAGIVPVISVDFVKRMKMYVCSWWSSFAMALNFAENRPQGAWRRSALCDVPVFIFM